ncbi:unnamed protein product [Caenorhabditis brenneri]
MALDELICWKTDPECIELMDFLIERTKNAESPISINGLAREFKQKSGSSQTISCLFYRIRTLREKAAELDTIDTATKVKMMFALSASIDDGFLKELRVDSHVEVDGKNRITEYKANDGGLEFEGDHSGSAKRKMKFKKMISEKSQNASPKTPGSVKRPAAELSNSSKRARDSSPAGSMKSENHAPNDPARTPESGAREPPNPEVQQQKMGTEKSQKDSDDGSQESVPKTPESVKRSAPEVPNSPERATDSSSAASMKSKDHASNDSARTPESGAEEPSSPKTPNPGIQSPRQPFPETPRARTHQEAPVFRGAPRTPGDEIPQEKPIKTESGIDDGYTSRIKLLEAIQSLVLSLDMPSLSPLLTRIEKKLRELSSNDKIPNDEMAAALELLVVKITNDSVSNLSETVESVSLSHFLCYLKSLILNSKLEGLEGLLEKIKGRIRDPATKDKMIAVEKVMSTLQPILDVIGF